MKLWLKIAWTLLWFVPIWAAFLVYMLVLTIGAGPRVACRTWDGLV